MLIHVTIFQRVQARVSDQVAEYVHFLRDRIRYGDGAAPSPVMEATDDATTCFYIHTLAVGSDRRLRLLRPQRITVEGEPSSR